MIKYGVPQGLLLWPLPFTPGRSAAEILQKNREQQMNGAFHGRKVDFDY